MEGHFKCSRGFGFVLLWQSDTKCWLQLLTMALSCFYKLLVFVEPLSGEEGKLGKYR